MIEYYEKDGNNFVVRFYKREKTVFIGTAADNSSPTCRESHELMASLKWKPLGTSMFLPDKDGIHCLAVGYKVPFWCNPRKKIDKLFNN